ncbi:hypothetical protein SAY86_022526 [Trapa natans]|uniref:Uncharacterized protein n=1 Tax=Trapa natans TaxID=22666 RepID=A0AAN7R9D1_TRANT|nr:hypothetical protein SAY86_022526 [Trapa natans]
MTEKWKKDEIGLELLLRQTAGLKCSSIYCLRLWINEKWGAFFQVKGFGKIQRIYSITEPVKHPQQEVSQAKMIEKETTNLMEIRKGSPFTETTEVKKGSTMADVLLIGFPLLSHLLTLQPNKVYSTLYT